MMRRLRHNAFAVAVVLLSSVLCRPSSASQATLVTPGSPLPMTGLATFLNAALLSIGSCNSGNAAPANGTGAAAFAEECWANTTGAPSSIPFAYYDGAQWVTFGTLNATAHTWTPNFGAPGSAGQLLIGQSSAQPAWQSCGGDCTSISAAGVMVIGKVNGNAWPSSGVSGGIPYWSAANTIGASALLSQYGVVYGGGAGGAPAATAAGTNGQLLLGQTGAAPAFAAMSGDATIAAGGALTIAANAVTNGKAAQMAANAVKGNPTGGTANAQDVAPATARSASLLNIDACTSTGDANYAIAATDRCVYHTALTAARTDTLPAANSVNAGQLLYVVDFRGAANATDTITIQRSGSDTVNGSTSAIAVNAQYGWSVWMSDGVSRWTYQQGGSGGGSGTVTSVGATGSGGITVSGSPITTSGTLTLGCSAATTAAQGCVQLGATLQAAPTAPGGFTTTTPKMAGLGSTCAITPVSTGRIEFVFVISAFNSTAGQAANFEMYYGTGTAPANNAAVTGTAITGKNHYVYSSTANAIETFADIGIITGLTLNTAYWFDVADFVSGGTGTINTVTCSAHEF
jgi:hypothetical protein